MTSGVPPEHFRPFTFDIYNTHIKKHPMIWRPLNTYGLYTIATVVGFVLGYTVAVL